ncbi:Uncharacterized protein TPAR_06991 [Tolypocladium paradoxum]|uniref:Uncharacterized protein n=1 Tax=Tolypocladium paradoxum TaxID=94208 RepID=A0A2S4KRL2_9HYPO|nr:Uncharacterized protein TPAR_06991 [Tolypocladium paradoxum]
MDPNPADSVRGGVPSAMIQNRHLPRRVAAPGRHRSFNHLVRANAKRLAQTGSVNALAVCETLGLPCAADGRPLDASAGSLPRSALRPQLEAHLRRYYGAARPLPRLRCRNRPAAALCGQDEAEGRDLAHSDMPLPGDRFRLARRPTLEREEAFRDASTSRGGVRLRRAAPSADDAQVAELYRLGLLYDEEQDRADDAFDLNSIQHEQPVYSIRPAKRARKSTKSRGFGAEQPLRLDLSFSDLGDDAAIAQFLRPSPHDIETTRDEAIQHAPRPSRQSLPPLRVVYELAGSRPSFDVDTSQPPDLVTDLLSDYDCFSDSELDDTPSQQEVHLSADNPPSDAWVMLGDDS